MGKRLLSAAPLILIALCSFLAPGLWGSACFFLLAVGLMGCGIREVFALLPVYDCWKTNRNLTVILSIFTILPLFAYDFVYRLGVASPELVGPAVGMITTFMLQPIFLVIYFLSLCIVLMCYQPTRQNVTGFFAALGSYFYIGWTLFFLVAVYFCPRGSYCNPRYLLLYLVAVAKMADTGAYIVGCSSAKLMKGGNHKLAPVLSPKKSWEGLIGGIVFSFATAYFLLKPLGLAGTSLNHLWLLVIIAVVAGVGGLIGDLVESALKRSAEVKDSGHLPGIGGVLDVLDSLIPLAPLFFLLTWFM